ncbi:MAG: hypothetical protein OQK82_08235 [Candidatus Pacearchaeota archaeon]|nr:hypothetical protein [Candidatus Pacearchaeota archaeon]
MTEYRKQTNCGELILEIEEGETHYKVNISMTEFGNCSAYKFISDMVAKELDSSSNPSALIKILQSYKCESGKNGCIEEIGNCLEEFSQNFK